MSRESNYILIFLPSGLDNFHQQKSANRKHFCPDSMHVVDYHPKMSMFYECSRYTHLGGNGGGRGIWQKMLTPIYFQRF